RMLKLIADIGATNARFALVENGVINHIQVLACADYPTLGDAAAHYLATTGARPETGAFAVATALDGSDHVAMTNHDWAFSVRGTGQQIGLKSLTVVNDFMALAHAVPQLTEKDRYQVGQQGTVQKNMP